MSVCQPRPRRPPGWAPTPPRGDAGRDRAAALVSDRLRAHAAGGQADHEPGRPGRGEAPDPRLHVRDPPAQRRPAGHPAGSGRAAPPQRPLPAPVSAAPGRHDRPAGGTHRPPARFLRFQPGATGGRGPAEGGPGRPPNDDGRASADRPRAARRADGGHAGGLGAPPSGDGMAPPRRSTGASPARGGAGGPAVRQGADRGRPGRPGVAGATGPLPPRPAHLARGAAPSERRPDPSGGGVVPTPPPGAPGGVGVRLDGVVHGPVGRLRLRPAQSRSG